MSFSYAALSFWNLVNPSPFIFFLNEAKLKILVAQKSFANPHFIVFLISSKEKPSILINFSMVLKLFLYKFFVFGANVFLFVSIYSINNAVKFLISSEYSSFFLMLLMFNTFLSVVGCWLAAGWLLVTWWLFCWLMRVFVLLITMPICYSYYTIFVG